MVVFIFGMVAPDDDTEADDTDDPPHDIVMGQGIYECQRCGKYATDKDRLQQTSCVSQDT